MNEPPIKADWFLPENMRRQAMAGEGVYGDYDAYARGDSASQIGGHAIIDPDYARAYVSNLLLALRRLGVASPTRGLDVGCAIGTITEALRSVLGGSARLDGIDLSESAIGVAAKSFPECRFAVCSADELDRYPDGRFDLIHVREFYPFTRTADAALHLRFLSAFMPKLATGGVVAAVQIVAKAGLADTMDELKRQVASLDCKASRHALVPLRLYRRIGPICHRSAVYPFIAAGLALLEAMRPGRVSYIYLFRKLR